jgi:hypothetical protein
MRALDLGSMCGSPLSSYGDGAATQDGHPTEVLAGLVERITFHNDENGFCVLRVKARGQRDLITILGHAANDLGRRVPGRAAAGSTTALMESISRPHF